MHVNKISINLQDTEFPGVVARATGNFRTTSEYHYQTLKCNVNMLKIIQLGLSFTDDDGNLPPDGKCTWQFNFKFNLKYGIFISLYVLCCDFLSVYTCGGCF